MYDEKEVKEMKRKEYLIKYKDYKSCGECAELVSPHDTHYDISLCDVCHQALYEKF